MCMPCDMMSSWMSRPLPAETDLIDWALVAALIGIVAWGWVHLLNELE